MGHIYSPPYALLEPGLVLVAVDGDEVAGFAAGAIDTLLWEDVLERTRCPARRGAGRRIDAAEGVARTRIKAWRNRGACRRQPRQPESASVPMSRSPWIGGR